MKAAIREEGHCEDGTVKQETKIETRLLRLLLHCVVDFVIEAFVTLGPRRRHTQSTMMQDAGYQIPLHADRLESEL